MWLTNHKPYSRSHFESEGKDRNRDGKGKQEVRIRREASRKWDQATHKLHGEGAEHHVPKEMDMGQRHNAAFFSATAILKNTLLTNNMFF